MSVMSKEDKNAVPTASTATKCRQRSDDGFTLVEMLIAIIILTFGLLAAGQLLLVAMGSSSLSRSKGGAAGAAANKVEFLADLYRQNPNASDLTTGSHGPDVVQVLNPINNRVLNRFNVAWTVATVPDPRAGKNLNARMVTVTVTPVDGSGATHNVAGLNKAVSVSSIFSVRAN